MQGQVANVLDRASKKILVQPFLQVSFLFQMLTTKKGS